MPSWPISTENLKEKSLNKINVNKIVASDLFILGELIPIFFVTDKSRFRNLYEYEIRKVITNVNKNGNFTNILSRTLGVSYTFMRDKRDLRQYIE